VRALRALFFFFLLAFQGSLIRAANDAGLPGEFLNFGVGARALGMGHAFTGVADDVDSIYWNPAGLATFRSSQLTLQHSPLILGGAYQYIAYSQPIYSLGTLGIGIVNLTSGDVPKVDSNNVEIGEFDSRETAYLVSYAYRFTGIFGLGTTIKMVEKKIDDRSARGFGADIGTTLDVHEKVRLGAMIRNIIPPSYNFSTDKEKFPIIMRTGASVRMFNNHLLSSLDLEKTIGTAQNPKFHFGLEGFVIRNIFFRFGWDQTELTTGVGVHLQTIQFDYAAGFQELGLVNRVSVKFLFGGYEVDVKASPSVFSPVGLKNKTMFRIDSSNRHRVVQWLLVIKDAQGEVVRSYKGHSTPPQRIEWDGRNDQGRLVRPGEYTYRMSVTDTRDRTETTPARRIKIIAPTPLEIEVK